MSWLETYTLDRQERKLVPFTDGKEVRQRVPSLAGASVPVNPRPNAEKTFGTEDIGWMSENFSPATRRAMPTLLLSFWYEYNGLDRAIAQQPDFRGLIPWKALDGQTEACGSWSGHSTQGLNDIANEKNRARVS